MSEAHRAADPATRLGIILVAEDIGGGVTLFIGDNRLKLLRDLKDAFPAVPLTCAPYSLARTIAKAKVLVDAPSANTDPAHTLRGSPLEVAVCIALRARRFANDAVRVDGLL